MADRDAVFEALRDKVRFARDRGEGRDDALVLCDLAMERGDPHTAATALDRAYGIAPGDAFVAELRRNVLDSLAVTEHGIHFRYVPAGTFVMGSETGERDERPPHAVTTGHYWLSDTPITWARYCACLGWTPPPDGTPQDASGRDGFFLYEHNKIRMQYCETHTEGASDWHAHAGYESLFGRVARPDVPDDFDVKPMVAVAFRDAVELGERLTSGPVYIRLPTEAEWEKAARGGLVGKRYAWGDEPPDRSRCDCDRFGDAYLVDPRAFPPNGYGLHGMCGGVSEWTSDVYDALAYRVAASPALALKPDASPGAHRVLRGGSWCDPPEAVTVSFRMSLGGDGWRDARWSEARSPTVGFRLCRVEHVSRSDD